MLTVLVVYVEEEWQQQNGEAMTCQSNYLSLNYEKEHNHRIWGKRE